MDMEQHFSRIYGTNEWSNDQRSGPGSDPALNKPYVNLVQKFMRDHHIESVVDLGCGDWSFSRQIDWSGIDYVGIDVVPELISFLNKTYGKPGVRFMCADLLTAPLPAADLALSKDVLQHWPTDAIQTLLKRLNPFKYAIITNDAKVVCRSWRRLWLGEEIFVFNSDIPIGSYRPVRLREAPFNLPATQLGVIKMYIDRFPDPQRRPEVEHKEVLLWTNPTTNSRAAR
jgi:SAM-dependent methyltransferase